MNFLQPKCAKRSLEMICFQKSVIRKLHAKAYCKAGEEMFLEPFQLNLPELRRCINVSLVKKTMQLAMSSPIYIS